MTDPARSERGTSRFTGRFAPRYRIASVAVAQRRPGSVAPPCPFEGEIPDIEVVVADSIEFGDEARQLGINHTVVELDGDTDDALAVLRTWEMMDCSDSGELVLDVTRDLAALI